jgi:hypothetical protein
MYIETTVAMNYLVAQCRHVVPPNGTILESGDTVPELLAQLQNWMTQYQNLSAQLQNFLTLYQNSLDWYQHLVTLY